MTSAALVNLAKITPVQCQSKTSTFNSMEILPLFPQCIPLFISYLSFWKLAFSTITSYLAAILYVHKLRGFPDPTKSFLIQKLLLALSHKRSVNVRLPVTRPVLHELIRSLRFTNSSAFQRSLYATMFLVAFYGLFRIGKLAMKSMRIAASVIQFNNLPYLFAYKPTLAISRDPKLFYISSC